MFDEDNRQVRSVKTLTTALAYEEWAAIRHLARKANLTSSQYLRAIAKDAIADEGLDVRLFQPQGRAPEGKASEASGAPAA